MNRVNLHGINFSYDDRPIIRQFSGSFDSSSLVGIVGRSGSGKTTLLKLLSGILCPNTGRIERNAHRISWVPQDAGLFPWLTVSENISCPLTLSRQKLGREDRRSRALELCGQLGLLHIEGKYPRHVSGGEKQRAGLGRALAASSEILLLDEPFASLDPLARRDLRTIIRDITITSGMLTVLATHDILDIALICDRVIVLKNAAQAEFVDIRLEGAAAHSAGNEEAAARSVQRILKEMEAG